MSFFLQETRFPSCVHPDICLIVTAQEIGLTMVKILFIYIHVYLTYRSSVRAIPVKTYIAPHELLSKWTNPLLNVYFQENASIMQGKDQPNRISLFCFPGMGNTFYWNCPKMNTET